MIVGCVTFQAMYCSPQQSANLRVNLILNNIFYNEINIGYRKYLCVTNQDILSVEVHLSQNEELLGHVTINEVCRLILEKQTIFIDVIANQSSRIQSVKLVFVFRPTIHYARKKLGLSNDNVDNKQQINNQDNKIDHGIAQMSHGDQLIQTLSEQLFNRTISPTKIKTQDSGYNIGEINKKTQEGMSYNGQSLAQQRQKILNELYGKFNRKGIN